MTRERGCRREGEEEPLPFNGVINQSVETQCDGLSTQFQGPLERKLDLEGCHGPCGTHTPRIRCC